MKEAEKKVVIIVDEYDSPIIDSYMDKKKADRIRDTLSTFYTVIKNNDDNVRFLFITGITKFSNMSIFSKMNNLTDLSLDEDYAAAFGYTQMELEDNFSEYIDAYMERNDREYETREDFLEAVKDYYDGYLFLTTQTREFITQFQLEHSSIINAVSVLIEYLPELAPSVVA